MLSHLKQIAKYSIYYAALTHCTFEYVGDFVECNGPSMEPTLYTKNILLTERITTRLHRANRGDIIIAVSPTNPTQYICKRVVGVAGDKIITKSVPHADESTSDAVEDYPMKHRLWLREEDDSAIDSSEISADRTRRKSVAAEDRLEYVPRGYVWIEGDNSANSSDSRYYGPIPVGLIKSRVICRLWPLKDIRIL